MQHKKNSHKYEYHIAVHHTASYGRRASCVHTISTSDAVTVVALFLVVTTDRSPLLGVRVYYDTINSIILPYTYEYSAGTAIRFYQIILICVLYYCYL